MKIQFFSPNLVLTLNEGDIMAISNKMYLYHYDQSAGLPGKKNSENFSTTLTQQQVSEDSDLTIAVTTFAQGICNLSTDAYGGVEIVSTVSLNETISELEG